MIFIIMKISSLIATSVFVSSLVFHPFNDAQNSAPFGVAYADEAQDFELLKASQSGDLSAAKKAIAAGANVNAMSGNGISAIMYAAGKGQTDIVRLLLKAGANPNLAGTTNITPLMCAAMYGRHDAVQMLLAAGAKRDVADDKGNTAYTYAAKFPAIAQMLAPQTAPQAQPSNASVDEDYNLMVAAQSGDLAAAKKAIAAGANVNAMSGNGLSVIMYAAGKGHTDIVRLLLKAGANIEAKEKNGVTPLMLAANLGHTEAVKALIQAGANANEKSKDGLTALAYAKGSNSKNKEEIINLLAPLTMNPVQLFVKGIENKDVKLVEKAIANGLDVKGALNQEGWTALMIAANRGHIEAIKALIQAGANIEAKDKAGWTPLMYAASEGRTEAIKVLVQAGAKLETKDKDGLTPLMIAAVNKFEAVKALIQAGAKFDAKDNLGWTPLMFSARENHTESIKALIQAGAKLEATNKGGLTPLMIAAANDKFEAVKVLCEAGADVNKMTKDYKSAYSFAKDKKVLGYLYSKSKPCTPLVEAVLVGDINSVRNLINSGVNVNASTEKQSPALVYAARYAYPEITKILLSAGAKVNTMDSYGSTPIHEVVTTNKRYNFPEHIEIAKILIKAGANVNLKGKKRRPILIEADNPELLQLLIKAGANVNEKWTPPIDSDIQTPLSTAIQEDNISKVKLLIRAGADVNCKIAKMSALSFATIMNKKEIAKLLKQAGAR